MSEQTSSPYHYWAFISHNHNDAKWARWLHRGIETYGIPAEYIAHSTPVGEPAPRRFSPSFHYRTDLAASPDLRAKIQTALKESRFLVVVCSPNAAQSEWVNREVSDFQALGRENQVLAFVVAGEPNSGGTAECFPASLRRGDRAPGAPDVRTDGKTDAKLKLLAAMLGVSFDALKQRDNRRRIRRLQFMTAAALALMITFAALAAYAIRQRQAAVASRNQAEKVLEFLVYDLGDDLEKVGRSDLAEKVRNQVDDYYRHLNVDDAIPSTLHNQLNAFRREGDLLREKGDIKGAKEAYERSLSLGEKLIAADPQETRWQYDLSRSLLDLGIVEESQGHLTDAQHAYERERDIARAQATRYPNNALWQRDLGNALGWLGGVQLAQGNLTGASTNFEESRDIAGRLVEQDPTNKDISSDFSVALMRLGDAQMQQGKTSDARVNYDHARETAEKLVAQEPLSIRWLNYLSLTLGKLGSAEDTLGNLAGARVSFGRQREVAEKLAACDTNNSNWQLELVSSLGNLGNVQTRLGLFAEARTNIERSSFILNKLLKVDPTNTGWRRNSCVVIQFLGDLQLAENELGAARVSYEEGLTNTVALIKTDPNNPDFQRTQDQFLLRLGNVAAKSGEVELARRNYSDALAISERLNNLDHSNSLFQKDALELRDKLAQLNSR